MVNDLIHHAIVGEERDDAHPIAALWEDWKGGHVLNSREFVTCHQRIISAQPLARKRRSSTSTIPKGKTSRLALLKILIKETEEKELDNIAKKSLKQIIKRIQSPTDNPRPKGSQKLFAQE
ncbi:MAG: hypothetical protein ACUVR0_11965 [Candidatus Aminicenantales bacterium]